MFGVTWNVTVPLPWPLGPDVIAIHVWLDCTCHWHAASDETFTLPDPPDAGMTTLVDDSVMLQALFCVTVKSTGGTPDGPVTVTVPVRDSPLFAAIESCTAPTPVPAAPAVIEIHGA